MGRGREFMDHFLEYRVTYQHDIAPLIEEAHASPANSITCAAAAGEARLLVRTRRDISIEKTRDDQKKHSCDTNPMSISSGKIVEGGNESTTWSRTKSSRTDKGDSGTISAESKKC